MRFIYLKKKRINHEYTYNNNNNCNTTSETSLKARNTISGLFIVIDKRILYKYNYIL